MKTTPCSPMATIAAIAALSTLAAATPEPAVAATDAAEVLLAEALAHNPEIAAARAAGDAAQARMAPAGALDDPMLETGIVNAPLPFNVRREDMTMKMLGISQRLPFPGKRALRRDAAGAEAASVGQALSETINRVMRDVRVNYEALRYAATARRLAGETLGSLQQLVSLAETRYATGSTTQREVLQAQLQVSRVQQEVLRLDEDQAQRQAELQRLLGRQRAGGHIDDADDSVDTAPLEASMPAELLPLPAEAASLPDLARARRPQLRALAALIDKSERDLALARRESYPDFDLRVSYGQRDRTPEGMPRDDMITFTVAVNLPLWHAQRQGPRVAEALALRAQATSMAQQLQLETQAQLAGALATERRQRANALLFRSTLQPQALAAYDSALAGYRVGQVELPALIEARMRLYETTSGEAEAIAAHNTAIADLNLLTGQSP